MHTVELSLSDAKYDRLQAQDDTPEGVVREALDRKLRVREGVEATETRRAGEAEEPLDVPPPGPLSDSPVGGLLS